MHWLFAEGDAFHPEANVEKMHSGVPLTDEDRWPWLRLIGDWMSEQEDAGVSAVVTCSALRRVYRDLLREGRPAVRFCHMTRRRPRSPTASSTARATTCRRRCCPASWPPSNRSSPTSPASPSPGTAARPRCSTACCTPWASRRPSEPSATWRSHVRRWSRPQHLTVHLAAGRPDQHAGNGQLILACLAGIAVIVVLISWLKMHPFLALILGSAALAAVAWIAPTAALTSFTNGFGSTAGAVGILIALGAMLGKILADSGGADNIVNRITDRLSGNMLPWGMALIAAIIGLPLFFEVGVVILVPVVILVARRANSTLMRIGIPALAGLSVLHGLVPPHPGPQTAIALLKADQSQTLIFGLIVAIPTLIISGPLLGRLMDRWVPVYAPASLGEPAIDARTHDREIQKVSAAARWRDVGRRAAGARQPRGRGRLPRARRGRPRVEEQGTASAHLTKRPSFGAALITIVLPVLLMLLKAISDLATPSGSLARQIFDTIGAPAIALLLAVLLSYFTLGRGAGMRREQTNESLGSGLPGIAGILLIVAAGGGFKQLLVDAGVANVIADWATGANISVLLLGWLVAVGIRLATGSATVATTTAAGIVGALAGTLSTSHLALLVLAIGCGSLFFSHVNDAGFWLVKQYFGLTVGQTIKSWSVMETVISVVGFIFVIGLSLVF